MRCNFVSDVGIAAIRYRIKRLHGMRRRSVAKGKENQIYFEWEI